MYYYMLKYFLDSQKEKYITIGEEDMDNNFNEENFNYTPQPEQPQKDGGHGLAIASLVVGIISILSCCCIYLSVILGVVGVVLAIISKSKSSTGKMETMALIGMILSIIGLVLTIGYFVFGLVCMQSPEYQEMYNEILKAYQ